jgi:hypothetical protein
LFFDLDRDRRSTRYLPLVETLALTLQPELRTSFQGMKVRSVLENGARIHHAELSCLGEIDWKSSRAGQITVDRSTFSLTAEASEAISWLKSRGEDLQATVLSEEPSDYAELNAILNPLVSPPSEAWWFVNPPDREGLRWETLSLPALSGSSLESLEEAIQARGHRLASIAQPFEVYPGEESWKFEWRSSVCPSRPAVVSTSPLIIIPQYDVPQGIRAATHFFDGEFPFVWRSLTVLGGHGPWLWNREHPFVRLVEEEDREWFASYEEVWPISLSEDLLQTRGRSALFLMMVLENLDMNLDLEILERQREVAEDFRPGFWFDLWGRVAVDPAEVVAWVQPAEGEGELWVFGPDGIEPISATDPRISEYLPDPGDEWKLTITYKNGSAAAPDG